MITVQKYKQFHNSKDFEKILKLSIPEFNKSIPVSYNDFCKNTLKQCVRDESIFILFDNDKPIGYFIMHIVNRKVLFSFSYIVPEERGKKYSNVLRATAFDYLKDKFDNLTVHCDPKNTASYKGLQSLLKRYNCKYNISEVLIDNKRHEKYEIQKFE